MSPDLPDYLRSRAILIGTSVYKDESFSRLPAAANSLKGLKEILVDPQLCGWPAERITYLHNPAGIPSLVKTLRRLARDTEDVLLVYYVGHGTITPRGELCLALRETEFDDPDVTGLEYERVRGVLLDSPARVKVVILDCCYSGRAIQALAQAENIGDITDIRGVYTIVASDHAAHVPPLEDQIRLQLCTSFTGELLDLIRTGILGAPDVLTLNMIYSHLRTRLRKSLLPVPNHHGTDNAGEFGFTRNAALLQQPIERFPRPEVPSVAAQKAWPRWIAGATVAGALVATAILVAAWTGALGERTPVASCGTGPTASGGASGGVVVGEYRFLESELLGEIYAGALRAKGITVTTKSGFTSREVSYPAVCTGQITIMPEYNGALLTTSVDPASKAVTTGQVDAALEADLPPSLMILDPAQAQDKDSVTVTQAFARKYHLASIADLRAIAGNMVVGPQEFQARQQGGLGLADKYGLKKFKSFAFLDDSGPQSIQALVSGQVQAADIFTSDPRIRADHLVSLADPQKVFTAGNIVPLVYKPGANATMIRTLNAISAKLTMADLLDLDKEVILDGNTIDSVAGAWLARVDLG